MLFLWMHRFARIAREQTGFGLARALEEPQESVLMIRGRHA